MRERKRERWWDTAEEEFLAWKICVTEIRERWEAQTWNNSCSEGKNIGVKMGARGGLWNTWKRWEIRVKERGKSGVSDLRRPCERENDRGHWDLKNSRNRKRREVRPWRNLRETERDRDEEESGSWVVNNSRQDLNSKKIGFKISSGGAGREVV